LQTIRGKNVNLSSDGFCDWKHAAEKLSQHETSKHHIEAIIANIDKLNLSRERNWMS